MTQTWRSGRTRQEILETLFNAPEIIFFDTETTGLKPESDYIIEIAAIKCKMTEGVQLVEIDRLYQNFEPPFAISEKISELTGLTNEYLAGMTSFESFFPKLANFFGAHPVIAAYNTPFDSAFMKNSYARLGKSFEPAGEIDVLEMARDCIGSKEVENFKLATVAALFGLEDAKFHSAIDDILVTKNLFDVFFQCYLEKNDSVEKDLIIPHVFSVSFYEKYQLRRIYVETDVGTVFFDLRMKRWGTKDANMDMIDMEHVEQAAWRLTGSSDQRTFEKFKGKITA